MEFENLQTYFEEKGYEVFPDGNAPYRRIIVSKQNQGGEYYESEWTKLSHDEQLEELEEMTAAVERVISLRESWKNGL